MYAIAQRAEEGVAFVRPHVAPVAVAVFDEEIRVNELLEFLMGGARSQARQSNELAEVVLGGRIQHRAADDCAAGGPLQA